MAREIDGIGFKTADRIAINLGFANDAPPRLDAGLLYALETLQEDGHTAFREADLRDYAAELLQTTADRLAARIDALVAARPARPASARRRRESPARLGLLQLPANDRAEQKIAAAVARLVRAGRACRRSRSTPPSPGRRSAPVSPFTSSRPPPCTTRWATSSAS